MNIDKNEIRGIHFFFKGYHVDYKYEDESYNPIYGQPYHQIYINSDNEINYVGYDRYIEIGEESAPK